MLRAARSTRGRGVGPVSRILSATVTAAAVLATAGLLAGCTTQATQTPTSTAASKTTPTPTASPIGNGTLTIGTLFPSTGATAFLGPPQLAGVKAAVADINAAGGVNGKPVVIVSADSGDATTKTAEASLAALVAQGADVIIGPSSSVLAQRLLTAAAAAQVPLISPAASYPQLSTIDQQNIFFRTIPSTSLQGVALGTLLPAKKLNKVALISSGDAIGQSIVPTLADTLTAQGGSLVANITLTSATTAAEVTAQLATAAPDAVVLDTADNGTQTKAFITALVAAGYKGPKLWLTSQNLADYSQALPAGLLTGSSGLLEGADADAAFQAKLKAIDSGLDSFPYAPEAYDATILAALAATLAHDDAGIRLAAQLRTASVGGIKCTSYAECLDVLRTEPIDYDGISGPLNLDAAGDPTSATYGIYTYTAENKYVRSGTATG